MKEMGYYECAFHVSPSKEEEAAEIDLFIKENIAKNNGVVESSDSPKRLRLAYLLLGNQESFFGAIRFTINPQGLEKFREALRENKKIMRFMIVEWERSKARSYSSSQSSMKKKEEAQADTQTIDKKLEEILGQ